MSVCVFSVGGYIFGPNGLQRGSKGAQKMQNHTEKVPKFLKISDSDTTKKIMFGVGFSRGKPKARSELNWGPYLYIQK